MSPPSSSLASVAVAMLALSCATSTPASTSVSSAPAPLPVRPIAWRHWDAASFADAKRERKIVVVAVETAWCHWCHVMDEQTWSDPAVQALLADRFVAVREDADARPDLAERYADWGWPALALLSPDGAPITELRGYQDKRAFAALLRSLVDKLDRGLPLERPSPSTTTQRTSLDAIGEVALAQLDEAYDAKEGGWGGVQKYPLYAPVEHALLRGALRGDDLRRQRAIFTAVQETKLVDPLDGGMFQYSLDGVWTAPHYEKLAEVNGNALGTFARIYTATRDDEVKRAGMLIARYVTTTLRAPSGAFYANQDADAPALVGKQYYALDRSGRETKAPPPVDTHVYASHNGRIIAGLARFAGAVNDVALLRVAEDAASSIERTHRRADGAFRHGAMDDAVHLGDQVAMGLAYLELSEASGDPAFRERARGVAAALAQFHDDAGGGYFEHPASVADPSGALDVRKPIRQNAEAARFLMKLGRLDDDASLKSLAISTLEAFADKNVVVEEGRMIGEYVLAIEEVRAEPLHFAIVESRAPQTSDASPLLHAALAVDAPHRLVEVLHPGEKYPDLGKPALYICGATFCSPPITDPALVQKKAAPFLAPTR